jgi:hypothetical protein
MYPGKLARDVRMLMIKTTSPRQYHVCVVSFASVYQRVGGVGQAVHAEGEDDDRNYLYREWHDPLCIRGLADVLACTVGNPESQPVAHDLEEVEGAYKETSDRTRRMLCGVYGKSAAEDADGKASDESLQVKE